MYTAIKSENEDQTLYDIFVAEFKAREAQINDDSRKKSYIQLCINLQPSKQLTYQSDEVTIDEHKWYFVA